MIKNISDNVFKYIGFFVVTVLSIILITFIISFSAEARMCIIEQTTTTTTTTEAPFPNTLDITFETSFGETDIETITELLDFVVYWFEQGEKIIIFDENNNASTLIDSFTYLAGGINEFGLSFHTALGNLIVIRFSISELGVYLFEVDEDSNFFGDVTYPETFHLILQGD